MASDVEQIPLSRSPTGEVVAAGAPAPADPAIDHDDEAVATRRADVDEKHRRLVQFLDACGFDAVLLGRSDSLSWFTSGGELSQGLAAEAGAVMIYANRQCRAILADNVQSSRVFEEEVAGLGFQLKERPWQDDPVRIVAEISSGRRVAGDGAVRGLPDELERLRPLRLALTRPDRRRLRLLGRALAQAIEATCRTLEPGQTEAEVAGQLAQRLIREGIAPAEIQVAADDRLDRYRQPPSKAIPIRRRAVVAATGRRQGLCASATRIVAFGPVDPDFRAAHGLAAMVDATCIYFSRPGETVADAFRRARRIYEKFGRPHEWTLDYQGFVTGYAPRELPLRPESPRVLDFDTALRWSPSVGAARSEDTIVIDGRGFEVMTLTRRWPEVEVSVKGFVVNRPGILER